MTKINKIIGIDASNIKNGGGGTHLIELLNSLDVDSLKDTKIIVWAPKLLLMKIKDYHWLDKKTHKLINFGFISRVVWQKLFLTKQLKKMKCDLLLVVGGSHVTSFKPIVVMSRNMLPFEYKELFRYGFSLLTLKFILLRWAQISSFRNANGIIFLTNYAKKNVLKVIGKIQGEVSVIPHGLNSRFERRVKKQKHISLYDNKNPYKLLYVSSIYPYKHQWHVLEAVFILRDKGYPLTLTLVGPSHKPSLKLLKKYIAKYDPFFKWVEYYGEVSYKKIDEIYGLADLGVFASTCENMPNVLLETMMSGLPIACSDKGPMPDILRNSGLYFNAEDPISIASNLQKLIDSPDLRKRLANEGQLMSKKYSWSKCSLDTMQFMSRIQSTFKANKGQ
jgi:glycosyltransferase involved in cell wall biosynthesis